LSTQLKLKIILRRSEGIESCICYRKKKIQSFVHKDIWFLCRTLENRSQKPYSYGYCCYPNLEMMMKVKLMLEQYSLVKVSIVTFQVF